MLASDTQFRRNLDLKKSGKDLAKLEAIIKLLRTNQPLEERHQDHQLKGAWVGFRDCHIEPDGVPV